MLKKVLIANRGEIACRVIRTCKKLGIATVAIYHHEDRLAPHVKLADTAVQLKGDVPTAAYLDQDQIIAICQANAVDGIHPGYGFLSENSGFVEKVSAAGITLHRSRCDQHEADGRQDSVPQFRPRPRRSGRAQRAAGG